MQLPETSRLLELVRKYDRPGPRYTSYPTALKFSESADRAALLDDAALANEPLSIYIHLPFCASLCRFCGCTNRVSTRKEDADDYLDLLEREIDIYLAARRAQAPAVVQLHLGGGTPNFLTPAQLERLGALLRGRFAFAPDAECGVELDPRTLTRAHVETLARMGFRRASLGVQDCEPNVQRAVNRVQPNALNARAFEWLRDCGFLCVNIDLMYGLPLQTAETWARTLETVAALKPDRLAVFNYAHVPWLKPAQKILEKYPRPQPAQKLAMLVRAIEFFTKEGFAYVGMDHFARPEDPLFAARERGELWRNFQGYSTHAGAQVLAFGISGISQTPRAFRQNTKDFAAYAGALARGESPLARGYVRTHDDIARGDAIMRLMCAGAVGAETLARYPEAAAKLEEFERDSLVERDAKGARVTPLGRLFVRNIAMAFDAYLTDDEKRFSKTV